MLCSRLLKAIGHRGGGGDRAISPTVSEGHVDKDADETFALRLQETSGGKKRSAPTNGWSAAIGGRCKLPRASRADNSDLRNSFLITIGLFYVIPKGFIPTTIRAESSATLKRPREFRSPRCPDTRSSWSI